MLPLKIDELYQQERSLAHDGKDEIILIFPLEFLLFGLEMAAVVLNHLFWVCIFGAIAEDRRQNRVLRIVIQPYYTFFDHNIPQVLSLFKSSQLCLDRVIDYLENENWLIEQQGH